MDIHIYADWDYFARQTSGGLRVNAGISVPGANAGLSKDLNPSLQAAVISRLKDTLAEQIRKGMLPKIIQDELMQGCLLKPEPTEDTVIEGEKCVVVLCAMSDENDPRVAHPVLLKSGLLKMPIELLDRINSPLTWYGELLPIPLNFMGRSYESVFLARAIANLRQ